MVEGARWTKEVHPYGLRVPSLKSSALLRWDYLESGVTQSILIGFLVTASRISISVLY